MKPKRRDWAELLQHLAKTDDPAKKKRLLKKYLENEQRRLLNGAILTRTLRLDENLDGTVNIVREDGKTLTTFWWSDFESALDVKKFSGVRAIVAILRRQASTRLGGGGKITAEARRIQAKERINNLRAEEKKLRAFEPGIKKGAVAAMLADRGLGGVEAIKKLLRRST